MVNSFLDDGKLKRVYAVCINIFIIFRERLAGTIFSKKCCIQKEFSLVNENVIIQIIKQIFHISKQSTSRRLAPYRIRRRTVWMSIRSNIHFNFTSNITMQWKTSLCCSCRRDRTLSRCTQINCCPNKDFSSCPPPQADSWFFRTILVIESHANSQKNGVWHKWVQSSRAIHLGFGPLVLAPPPRCRCHNGSVTSFIGTKYNVLSRCPSMVRSGYTISRLNVNLGFDLSASFRARRFA